MTITKLAQTMALVLYF